MREVKVNALTIHEYTEKSGRYCWVASVRQGVDHAFFNRKFTPDDGVPKSVAFVHDDHHVPPHRDRHNCNTPSPLSAWLAANSNQTIR